MGSFRWFPPTRAEVDSVVKRALQGAGEVILEESNRTVPLLEGPLMASGVVDADARSATVSYDTPYAVVQHEDMTFTHAPGRRAKFLQLAVQEHAARLGPWLQTQIGAIFR